jgi:hypothetical protein
MIHPRVWRGCNSKLSVCLVFKTGLGAPRSSSMENDLHARAQILARLRCGRSSFSDRWDSSGGITRTNYLTPAFGAGGSRAADKRC